MPFWHLIHLRFFYTYNKSRRASYKAYFNYWNWASTHLTELLSVLQEKGFQIHGDEAVQQLQNNIIPATEEGWGTEYLGLEVALRVVGNVDEAITHINQIYEIHIQTN
ncbi:hypothetical protein PY093_13170 [Cytobacillus sp. S13-E01]|uniref:hypothetical protein n=1 Tax=Cytobacillus sp. S13-E01 TaxID=3031326 RepID=UPI0023D7C99E|nr:hypothetical protein [Cytobacillus sp. S13-E01]MDF0727638.1 hypothetical protein [Cytobacillus sp. S13-E01]